MFLNRDNIDLIHAVKAKAEKKGLVFTQTNSRLNGNYLVACRIYRKKTDKGHPSKAIWEGTEARDFKKYLSKR